MSKFRTILHRNYKFFVISANFVFVTCSLFIMGNGLHAQQTDNPVISSASLLLPPDFFFNKAGYVKELNSLKGLRASSPRVKQLADKIAQDLRLKGYTFSRVEPKFSTSSKGRLDFAVLVGKNGDSFVTGNDWLSTNSVLNSLSWQSGDFFNYAVFQNSAAKLNANRFVNVDSKLKPRRSRSGEIIVDADFKVEDSLPLVLTANIANDGNAKSSGWRSTLGLEWWEPFPTADKISVSWLTDPENTSSLNSFSAQYLGSYSDDWNWALFTGFSESEYNDVLSPVSFDIFGEGFFAGFFVSHKFAQLSSGSVSFNAGLTYLDLENSFSFVSSPTAKNKSELSFFVPRFGLQGTFDNPEVLPGRSFWSLSVLTDAGSADDAELKLQRPGASSGFFAGQLSLTTLQSIAKTRQAIDLYLNFASQLSNDALPSSLQKSIGGVDTVRGYDEREVFGDHGFNLNSELRFGAFSVGGKGTLQPFTFVDVGYVSSEESLSGSKDSTSLRSAGAGFRCTFKPTLDLGFHLGVPLKESPDTEKNDPRVHFNLDFRF
ncbi:hypothetical protein OAV71_04965 [Opitutales bacterium]|nr:hypothetical protein [Opitutales bacterium]